MRTVTFHRVVGAGAMGTVYHAELGAPGGFRRTCAVKIIRALEGDYAHFVTRMRDEARLLGLLDDEAVLGVSELVQVSGRDAVIMELVEGVDLDALTSSGVPPRALAEVGAELAGVLHRIHTANHPATGEPLAVVHRDVKPGNVMVTARGGIKLLDFGVARAVFGERESETRGLVLGTLNYFAPEVLLGEPPSPAIDLYGLGLTLWEAATGLQWGPPVVQQSEYADRLERALARLSAGHAPLRPVLASLLAFEPLDRPSGGRVEEVLLSLADRLDGEGLRTWAREQVPRHMDGRPVPADEESLVGETLPIEEVPEAEPLPEPEPMPAAPVPAGRPSRREDPGWPLWTMALVGVGAGILIAAILVALFSGVWFAMGAS